MVQSQPPLAPLRCPLSFPSVTLSSLRAVVYSATAMSNPNGGGIPVIPQPSHLPEVIPLDPEVEELWSSRALLLVSGGPLVGCL